jgi:dinuclear metal center YbgI/SA1388 family protein
VTSVGEVVAFLERRYPPAWAESWDRVGLVLGEPAAPVRTVLLVVDCVPETVDEAMAVGADLIVAHHPLLLRGVASVAPTTYKGRLVHRLIKADIALHTAHTNADVAAPGVSDALAARLGLTALRPLVPSADDPRRGTGRIGVLPAPVSLRAFAARAAQALPRTAWGVRAAGDPDREVGTVAVCGGAGDPFLRYGPGSTRTSPPTCATIRSASTSPTAARPSSRPHTGPPSNPGSTSWPPS